MFPESLPDASQPGNEAAGALAAEGRAAHLLMACGEMAKHMPKDSTETFCLMLDRPGDIAEGLGSFPSATHRSAAGFCFSKIGWVSFVVREG